MPTRSPIRNTPTWSRSPVESGKRRTLLLPAGIRKRRKPRRLPGQGEPIDEISAWILRTVGETLLHLNQRKIPHSAMRPSSIFLTKDGRVRLTNISSSDPKHQSASQIEIRDLSRTVSGAMQGGVSASLPLRQLLTKMLVQSAAGIPSWGALLQAIRSTLRESARVLLLSKSQFPAFSAFPMDPTPRKTRRPSRCSLDPFPPRWSAGVERRAPVSKGRFRQYTHSCLPSSSGRKGNSIAPGPARIKGGECLQDQELLRKLSRSKIFKDFSESFRSRDRPSAYPRPP